jgi:hypothetical protein
MARGAASDIRDAESARLAQQLWKVPPFEPDQRVAIDIIEIRPSVVAFSCVENFDVSLVSHRDA